MRTIYRDKAVQLIHGEAVEALYGIADASADALVTDPPYSSGGLHTAAKTASPASKYQVSGTKKAYPNFIGDARSQRGQLTWLTLWMLQCHRVLRDGSPALVFTDWRQLGLTADAIESAGFVFRGIVAWNKTGSVRPQGGRFAAQCEYIVWGSKGKFRNTGTALPGVFSHRVNPSEKKHVTGKPIPLMHDLLQIVNPGGLVIDPFAGSASTLVAAKQMGLRAIGIEQSAEYCEISKQRLKETKHHASAQSK